MVPTVRDQVQTAMKIGDGTIRSLHDENGVRIREDQALATLIHSGSLIAACVGAPHENVPTNGTARARPNEGKKPIRVTL